MIELVRIEGTRYRVETIVLERSDGGESAASLIVQMFYLVLHLYIQFFHAVQLYCRRNSHDGVGNI